MALLPWIFLFLRQWHCYHGDEGGCCLISPHFEWLGSSREVPSSHLCAILQIVRRGREGEGENEKIVLCNINYSSRKEWVQEKQSARVWYVQDYGGNRVFPSQSISCLSTYVTNFTYPLPLWLLKGVEVDLDSATTAGDFIPEKLTIKSLSIPAGIILTAHTACWKTYIAAISPVESLISWVGVVSANAMLLWSFLIQRKCVCIYLCLHLLYCDFLGLFD